MGINKDAPTPPDWHIVSSCNRHSSPAFLIWTSLTPPLCRITLVVASHLNAAPAEEITHFTTAGRQTRRTCLAITNMEKITDVHTVVTVVAARTNKPFSCHYTAPSRYWMRASGQPYWKQPLTAHGLRNTNYNGENQQRLYFKHKGRPIHVFQQYGLYFHR